MDELSRQSIGQRRAELVRKYGSHVVLLLLVTAASLLSPNFLTPGNIFIILRQAAPLGIVAVGQTFVILSGNIDLTVGSVLSFATVIVCHHMRWSDARIVPLLFACLALGAATGVANGFGVNRLKLPPIIITLGMSTLLDGLNLTHSKGIPLGYVTDTFRVLGRGHIGPVPIPVVLWAGVIALGFVLLNNTTFGRYVYAAGGNLEATRLSGVNTGRIITLAYVVSGMTAAIAGYLMAARLGIADNWVGKTFTLDSVAAVAIGGTSLAGGRGSLISTVSGVLLLSVLYNLLLLLGFSYFWQEVVKGIVILGGVLLYTTRRTT
jgi:ribose/xylose/arabinose/galactoside ABC-type transport system permease subunit